MTRFLDPAFLTANAPALLLGAVAAAALTLMVAELTAQRRRRIAARLAALRGRAGAPTGPDGASVGSLGGLSPAVAALMDGVMAAVFAREADRRKMRQLIRAAGLSPDGGLIKLAAAKAALGVAAGLAGWGLAVHFEVAALASRAALILGGAVAGAIAPEAVLKSLAAARRERLRDALPDAIDLLVITANAGQSLDMALDRVSREMEAFAPDLSGELRLTVAEMQALPDRAGALRNLSDRTDIAEIKAFVMTLVQSVRYGSAFSDALRALGADLRAARLLAAEERGAKLPALLTLPLIIFIMPAVFVVVIGPAAVSMGDLFGK